MESPSTTLSGGPAGSPTGYSVSPDVHIEWVYSPLAPESVRWYSYRAVYDPKELAKATEIPHRGSLLRFCAADSAALEAAYRERHDELEACWWEEEAALHSKDSAQGRRTQDGSGSSGGAAGDAGAEADDGGALSAAFVDPGPDTSGWAYFMGGCSSEHEPGVLVRSGAFEVDLRCRQLRPCYWPASRHRVLRGTWFVEKSGEWVPLKEALAEQLEEGYRQAIWTPSRGRLAAQPGGGYAARLELSSHVESGLYALFAAEDEAWLCQETGWAWLRRIGASSTAGQSRLRLRRGYEEPASKALLEKEADQRQEELDQASAAVPVSRLVLVVHGIGQKLAAANIAQDASSFRSVLRQVAQDQAASGLLDEVAAGRTEVLPVQWRKHLHIEADQLSRQLMPPGIPSLRQTLHSTVVEILLYMSPQHRPGIVSSLATSLNSTYQRFMARNPGFQGTVSILAHSLGTVLCYDILCHQQEAWASPRARSPSRPVPMPLPALPAAQQQAEAGQEGGAEEAPIDLTADSPTAALQQELARLRAENQRLRLRLDLVQGSAADAEAADGEPDAGGEGSPGALVESPAQGQRSAAGDHDAEERERYPPRLLFTVDQLVMLGSPLGCFLALRGVDQARGAALGSAASAQLMQLAPDLSVTPDGLPAVRRLHNLYHPYDPVAHRLEPLVLPPDEVQRAAFVPLFKGGKRIHLAVQESLEDVGTAASRLGTTLLSSLAFAKLSKSTASLKSQEANEDGGGSAGSGSATAAAAAARAAEEAADAAAEEAAARRMGGTKSAPALAASRAAEQAGREVLQFGALERASPGGGGCPSGGASGAQLAQSPTRAALRQGGSTLAAAGRASSTGNASKGAAGIARVVDGVALPGSKYAQGRLDFVMQESSLENQYLSALSAHFAYWSSPDVALFVLRAVHDLDVLTGDSKQQALQAQQARQAQQAQQVASPRAPAASTPERRQQRVEPTSPRQHLIALL